MCRTSGFSWIGTTSRDALIQAVRRLRSASQVHSDGQNPIICLGMQINSTSSSSEPANHRLRRPVIVVHREGQTAVSVCCVRVVALGNNGGGDDDTVMAPLSTYLPPPSLSRRCVAVATSVEINGVPSSSFRSWLRRRRGVPVSGVGRSVGFNYMRRRLISVSIWNETVSRVKRKKEK